jgi:hypothetical protein
MLGNILGILGVVLTIVLGYYSIWLTKKTKQITSLTFKKNECFSLFSSAVKNLKINVEYKDKKIENSLILFRGEITNSGTTDIDKAAIYVPLTISTNEKYSWVEVFLINKRTMTNPSLKRINEREIVIEWDLLKKGEKIEFEALVETKNSGVISNTNNEISDFYNSLEFNYRITNLDEIYVDDGIDKVVNNDKKIKKLLIPFVLFIVAGLFFLLAPLLNNSILHSKDFIDVYYELRTSESNSTFLASIAPQSNGNILIENIDGKDTIISLSSFNKSYSILGIMMERENFSGKLFTYLGWFMIFFSITQLIVRIVIYSKTTRRDLILKNLSMRNKKHIK